MIKLKQRLTIDDKKVVKIGEAKDVVFYLDETGGDERVFMVDKTTSEVYCSLNIETDFGAGGAYVEDVKVVNYD